jgi:monofunctional biosynthetic peptidoglycan transglycosylase
MKTVVRAVLAGGGPPARRSHRPRPRPLRVVAGLALGVVVTAGAYLAACWGVLALLVWVDPPTTTVQIQRRVEAWFDDEPYVKRYVPVPLAVISPHLRHAVVAAEDARFFAHGGVDWDAIETALTEQRRRGRLRGASTITQQLVKNLFLTTHRNAARKVLEVPLAYLAELTLSKERILELYLNVVEWGRGIHGAEAAARHYYGIAAQRLDRRRAAALAACLPDPRHRSPARAGAYRETILARMRAVGW